MHEVLLYGATAFGGTLSLFAARLRWLRRRRDATLSLGDKVSRWGPLPSVGGGEISSSDLKNHAATVVVFMSNRCPGVKAYDSRLRAVAEEYRSKGVEV